MAGSAPVGGGSADGSSQPDLGIDSETSSLGEIVGEITSDLSTLMRQELDLMKAELKAEASKAGAGVGMLGGAGFAGYFLLLFLSVALMAALDAVMPLGWAALIVAVLWGIVAAVLAARGRSKLKDVNPKPEQTIETLKEDAQWAKHPTK
ncbi:MAG: phage holin family protein [Frankiaceae bacterium]